VFRASPVYLSAARPLISDIRLIVEALPPGDGVERIRELLDTEELTRE
jgi:hypothetical protein